MKCFLAFQILHLNIFNDYPQSILIERQDNLRLIFIENSLKTISLID